MRAKAEQHDMAIAVLDVEGGSVAVEMLLTEEITRNQRGTIDLVLGECRALELIRE